MCYPWICWTCCCIPFLNLNIFDSNSYQTTNINTHQKNTINIKMPGISINSKGIEMPGISINSEGIEMPGISIKK